MAHFAQGDPTYFLLKWKDSHYKAFLLRYGDLENANCDKWKETIKEHPSFSVYTLKDGSSISITLT